MNGRCVCDAAEANLHRAGCPRLASYVCGTDAGSADLNSTSMTIVRRWQLNDASGRYTRNAACSSTAKPCGSCIEAAALALGSDLATARQRTGITDEHVLLYREQVAIAQTLTSRHFLDTACDPRLPAPDRRAFIDSQIQKALNVPAAHPNVWRATGRVWTVTRALADELLDAAFIGRKPSDSVFQLLQYSSLADGQGLPRPDTSGPVDSLSA